ncbi:alpha/beta fold hydrolase [Gemmata sp.]|uniref:alpha/beta fold hydrolase n=1 Tax=Gemmata sp. TaxID=1914242 RepID=UPI003F6F24C4
MNAPPLILLPGMGADARLFASQIARFPTLRVPQWLPPKLNESLRHYSGRFASLIDPGGPCIVGGASFGGIVALEMAAQLRATACVLIGSIRSPAELSRTWRSLRPLAALGPDRLCTLAGALSHVPWLGTGTRRRLRRIARPEAALVRWAMCAVLRWQPSPATRAVRVFQIHGECDHTLPAVLSRADEIVPGGQHALSLFNPSAVNDYLERVVRAVTSSAASSA